MFFEDSWHQQLPPIPGEGDYQALPFNDKDSEDYYSTPLPLEQPPFFAQDSIDKRVSGESKRTSRNSEQRRVNRSLLVHSTYSCDSIDEAYCPPEIVEADESQNAGGEPKTSGEVVRYVNTRSDSDTCHSPRLESRDSYIDLT